MPDDGTIDLIKSLDDQIKIITTPWYPKQIKKGAWRYDQFEDIALFTCQGDWIFSLQADEVVHEEDLPKIKEAMTKYADDLEVEGLLVKLYQFYGGYNFRRIDRRWPPGGVRIVRNGINVYSGAGSQTFYIGQRRKMRYLRVAQTDARVYHYGWVRNPEMMQKKSVVVGEYDSSAEKLSKMKTQKTYDFYNVKPRYLAAFEGSHPKVMQDRISKHNWFFDPSECHYKPTLKSLLYDLEWLIERAVGKQIFGPHYYRKIVKYPH
ncbi:MAG: glycosyltransferase family protein [Planctomycetota bacterium]